MGIGKSHVAQALGFLACQKGYAVRYTKLPGLLTNLVGGHADGSWEQRLRSYLLPDLLILDDFGLRDLTAQQSEDLYELICERHLRRSTLVVSNRRPQEWYGLFANPVLAEGALGRLVNSSYHLLMEGASYRPRRKPTQPGEEAPTQEVITQT